METAQREVYRFTVHREFGVTAVVEAKAVALYCFYTFGRGKGQVAVADKQDDVE